MEAQDNLWRGILTPQEQDTDTPDDYQHEDFKDFENVGNENHTPLNDLIKALDHLQIKVDATENQPTEAINHLEWDLLRLSLALHPSVPPEPLDDVLQQYTETLCTAQKKTTFANTLLQDIAIFNGSDSSQLEDWLIDVETAVNLTRKSRTELAQAKSKGLTHTLITEALNLDKSWEEIKDLLHLKICNLDHPYISKLLYGYPTKGQGISSSLHPQI